jgi:hypothetical protein
MRAATVIVGAIAASSCLIALALVLTSGSDNSNQARVQSKLSRRQAAGSVTSEPAGPSGPVECNVEVTVEGGSCFLGKSLLAAYADKGGSSVTAVDSQSGEEVSFQCSGTAPTICESHNGITVYLAP